jgi:hypothetical protein
MRDPTLNDADDAPRDAASEAEWARWEQTFRDARPVLPDAAMARIEALMHKEAARSVARPGRCGRIVTLVILVALAVGVGIWRVGEYRKNQRFTPQVGDRTAVDPSFVLVEDRYPLDVLIGPHLAAPNQPILPLERYERLIHGVDTPAATEPGGVAVPPASPGSLLLAAQRLFEQAPTARHAIGLIELRRSAGVEGSLPVATSGNLAELSRVTCWRMLPLRDGRGAEFAGQLRRLQEGEPADFWTAVFANFAGAPAGDPGALAVEMPAGSSPREFPSRLGDAARYEMLVELGLPDAQAWLTTMTSRDYDPLAALEELDRRFTTDADALRAAGKAADAGRLLARRDALRNGYLDASHDLIERLFALRLLGRTSEADALLAQAKKIKYLNDPQDLAILLARLGPAEVSAQLVRPMLAGEVAFIQNPPRFDAAGPSPGAAAIVSARTKSAREGVTTYLGNAGIHAGPLQILGDQITAFRTGNAGAHLSATGGAHLKGVVGLIGAKADEITFDTETGTVKLSGHVHLDLWEKAVDLKECTITRTGEIQE